MRVLHVIQRYWPYVGGSERHLQEVSERLAREGHEVTVYTTDAFDLELFWARGKRRVPAPAEQHNGVAIRRFPVRHLPGPPRVYPGLRFGMTLLSALPLDTTPLLRRLAPLAPRVPELTRALRELADDPARRPDVVHGVNICFEGLLYPARELARRCGAPFFVTPLTHLGEEEGDGVRRYYTMRHQIALCAEADAVFAETDLEVDYLVSRGVPKENIARTGSGVNPEQVTGGDPERFRQRGITGPFVFYIGTAAYDKGTVHLVDAMRLLWRSGEKADLVLAGPMLGSFREYLDGLSAEARARCHLLGIISEEEKRDLLAAGSVFAMPSRTDSLGIAYLEAWLNGKPVIGAQAGGVPEIISDGVDGYLVPFGDVHVLADRLAWLLGVPRQAEELGQRGREKVLAQYTWDKVYPQIRGVYERLWQTKGQTKAERQQSMSRR